MQPVVRIVIVLLACLAMAVAGGAPSDHHVDRVQTSSATVAGS
jgi:hypothetical protein